jgi:hypothetical protein
VPPSGFGHAAALRAIPVFESNRERTAVTLEIIEDARRAWRWFSVQAMALTAAIQLSWTALPEDLKRHFPPRLVTAVSIALLLLGIGGRLVRQRKE